MNSYKFSPRASIDFEEIWDYSATRFGIDQAENYPSKIMAAIKTVAEDARRSRSCEDIRPGYRKYAVGSHMIFLRKTPDGIVVVRILHQKMDFDRHLPSSKN